MKISSAIIPAAIAVNLAIASIHAAGPEMVLIPGGEFAMGDHHDLGGREHRNDEVPVHTVRLDAYRIGKFELTTAQFCEALNHAIVKKQIRVAAGLVYPRTGEVVLCETRVAVPHSRVGFDGTRFSVLDGAENHPMTGVRWHGAAACCNWLSQFEGLTACYDKNWGCDYSADGYRLPTEAEWEYAGRGGLHDPYAIFPWGDDTDPARANWPRSGDPYETGPEPWTTPVGFFDGSMKEKAEFGWPGSQKTYQTKDGSNGYGLHDMAGNAWEWCNDLYANSTYGNSETHSPEGPDRGKPMPDGKVYHVLRSGNWYNGEWGHSRVSNRNLGYFRGPQDPNHPYYHIGLRVVRPLAGKDGTKQVAASDPPARRPERGGAARNERGGRENRGTVRERGGRNERGGGADRQPHRSPETSYGEMERQLGLIKNTDKACPGYTLFAPKHFTNIYLIANDGQIVNEWESEYEPGQSVYLLPNGNMLHCCLTKNKAFIGGGEGGRLEEFDWDGNVVWEYWLSDDKNLMHHDIAPLPNGNILAMVVELKTLDEAVQAGFNPNVLQDGRLFPDYVVEIEKTGPKSGKIVWQWHVWDHLVQDFDKTKDNYGVVADHPELIDPNGSGRRSKAFWNHFNSIDYNAELDQIVISVRGNSEIWVVDHSTTTKEAASHQGGRSGKGGDLIYRWGNPATYQKGGTRDQRLFQQHDSQWIPAGSPGAGNLLIFNNGLGRGYTSVDEIVPPMDTKGNYVLGKDGTYGPDKPVWTYTDPNPETFYSQEISGAHRLPNGNTLICAGVHGTLFEVTPEGETVWEYVNPVTSRVLKQGETVPLDHRYHAQNAVFKVHRYPPDYSAFKGRKMKPRGPLVEPLENPKSPARRAMPEHAGRKPDGGRGGGGGRRGGERGGNRDARPDDRRGGETRDQERNPPPRPGGGGGRGGDRFTQSDTDKDGAISLAEFIAHEKEKKGDIDEDRERQKFTRIDTDKNGSISKQELEAAPKGPGGRRR